MRNVLSIFFAISFWCLFGCEKKTSLIAGKYKVDYIDLPKERALYYVIDEDSSIGRIESRITDVGWDEKHVIVKRSIDGLNKICYYIIDVQKDNINADPSEVVTGPMSKEKYHNMRLVMNVSTNLKFTLHYNSMF
jgi:hypothetical protein